MEIFPERVKSLEVTVILWALCDFLGLRAIWEKFRPPTSKETGRRPPATFVLWAVGLYAATFGIASQRYENSMDRIERRINGVDALLADDPKQAIERIPEIQRRVLPYRPRFSSPWSVARSFVSPYSLDAEGEDELKKIREELKRIIVNNKEKLAGVNLREADLHGADLRKTDLRKTDLRKADLRGADLRWAALHHAKLDPNTNTATRLHSSKLSRC
jgi:hypothetical protein